MGKGKRSRSPSLGRSCNSDKKPWRMINVIFEGVSIGQNRSYSCKKMSASQSMQVGKRPCPKEPISFFEEDLGKIFKPHEDPLVIEGVISGDCRVSKVMADNGSTVEILYYSAFLKMGYKREISNQQENSYMVLPTQ